MYLLIKYIKSLLWRVAKRLSYIEDAWCLKVNGSGNLIRALPSVAIRTALSCLSNLTLNYVEAVKVNIKLF